MRILPLTLACLVSGLSSSAAAQTDSETQVGAATIAGFVSLGPSVVHITHNTNGSSGAAVGTQVGVISLSLEARVLFFKRFGFAVSPLTWQPSGGSQDHGDHWRFVRVGGGPRLQLLSSQARAQLTFGYDISYLRATDVEYCIICFDGGERSRTFTGSSHSFSLRLDTPIGNSSARVGARLDGGFSSDRSVSWLSIAASVGIGQRT